MNNNIACTPSKTKTKSYSIVPAIFIVQLQPTERIQTVIDKFGNQSNVPIAHHTDTRRLLQQDTHTRGLLQVPSATLAVSCPSKIKQVDANIFKTQYSIATGAEFWTVYCNFWLTQTVGVITETPLLEQTITNLASSLPNEIIDLSILEDIQTTSTQTIAGTAACDEYTQSVDPTIGCVCTTGFKFEPTTKTCSPC